MMHVSTRPVVLATPSQDDAQSSRRSNAVYQHHLKHQQQAAEGGAEVIPVGLDMEKLLSLGDSDKNNFTLNKLMASAAINSNQTTEVTRQFTHPLQGCELICRTNDQDLEHRHLDTQSLGTYAHLTEQQKSNLR